MASLLDNWPLKLLSLVTAIILWFYVLGKADPQTTGRLSVPVMVSNVPQGLEAIRVSPEQAEIRLRGRESALKATPTERIRLVADLSGAKVGSNRVALRPEGVPAGLTVVPPYTATANVELDKVIERPRPLDTEVRGKPAQGFVVDEVVPAETEVTVRGPASRVREVTRAVAVVDTSGLTESVPFTADAEPRNNRNWPVQGVTTEPSSVTVAVKVRPVHVKHLPVRPRLGSPPSGYRVAAVTTDPLVVTVTSDEEMGNIDSISTLPVDISGLRGTKSYPVSLNVPSGLSVAGPAAVEVTVTTGRVGGEAPAPGQPEPGGESGSSEGASEEDNAPESGNQQEREGGDQDNAGAGGSEGGDVQNRPGGGQDDSTVTPGSEGAGR